MAISVTLTEQDALDYFESFTKIKPFVPNVQSAPDVTYTADAVPVPIAPEAPQATSLDPVAVFGQSAPMLVPEVPIAAVPPPPPVPPVIVPIPQQRDTAELPWDARIHSSTKALNKDGTWRLKRGVTEGQVGEVTAELKQLMAIPSPQMTLPHISPPAAPLMWPHAVGYVPPEPTTAVPPPPPTPDPEVSLSNLTFPALVAKINTSGISKDRVQEACVAMGIPSIPMLAARPDLIPQIAATLGL